MADNNHSRSPPTDFYSILGITTSASSIKEICKAYKSLVTKKNPDKNNNNDSSNHSKHGTINETNEKRSTTPIVFSQSPERKKPPPVERKLECTLEELLDGCLKKIVITRNVIAETGIIVQEEETLWINVKAGWKKGTKIRFEGKGDEKPGFLPADIILCIEERRHPLYEREGDDLEIVVEIPLVNALTGCSIPVPLLGGDKMTLSFDDIIYHGYEKVIRGQGMPNNPKQHASRGDLRIKFLVDFPVELSNEQRAEAAAILLQDSS
ncbi:uncharacterized protein LOC133782122 isoform X2 [Humulus lupulus]|uniref:uncharacterized protein LOC133782122 isoform X2 n=1 Tax=Humulus lupulus TaxID=3486 RepID=UPI002B413EFD|nr:uncharacterized protein LOC133782122 isoform X2 [Humulus lupulus]